MDELRVTAHLERWITYSENLSLTVNIISSDNVTQYVFQSMTPFPKPEWQALIDGHGDKQVAVGIGGIGNYETTDFHGNKKVVGGFGLSVCETDNSYYLITDENREPEESRDQPNILVKVPRALLAPELAKALDLEPPVNLENNIKG